MTAATTTPPVRQPLIKSRALRRFLSHKLAMIGLFMVLGLTFACFVGPYLLPYDELYIDLRARFAPPGTGGHIFGTDPLGRDLAARLFHAGQISMAVGFAVMVIATTVGSVVGVVSGYYGGKISAVLMRVVDAFLSFPSVFLLLALAAFIQPGPVMIAVIISATSWMEVARIVEAEVKSLRNQDFVQAAHMLGLSGRWIMFRELLPNAIGPIIVAASLTVARAILLEAYISFLGYGIQPPLPSWGNLLNGAQQYLGSAPWLAIVPGLAITIAVTGFNFIGDGLRDAFDSRAQGQ
ncbi:ABC transporter permease [Sulfitobacter pseudonitzschiae]|uniref:ABC transporter permease n=1 Tax=Pseudosulfitobacter pseudonitzschiae TaxID=1402135 RepID=A0A9Q2RWN8_9RHOB|nr:MULTISPECIES: ABC transporter permease [Roseobacteraceae]MBM2293708.1 ABC transporter permease [Pseudosulfitobacter pseudonitzschiae]MBM2298522.1 ABC transporter permease [Pseudosulfitobacter pseudonitzschiae]MBM2303436.1 ABC transporter permease [Pseudosulfitobacter pseudonitzschiae]MBM2313219.1 ABC transporter permease [Pseudosulfitobacter pseudonitzschiae]MBM2318132.1 ABC transporter permease [Pseudosulfitobacter pseudonitzschiae]|tara:strand:- start:158028 stop:158909 length:882 start_codon:yes stop_codon:yes gene_type:complete